MADAQKMSDAEQIREGLRSLPLDVSHNASRPPEPREVYTPKGHEGALDPDRAIVVGNRGAGKSFWSGALIDDKTRKLLDVAYPKLNLGVVRASLGFSGDDFSHGAAPSPAVLGALFEQGVKPEIIWRAVLLKSLNNEFSTRSIRMLSKQILSDPEMYEEQMLQVDMQMRRAGLKRVLVFDALDRLGETWQVVRNLTRGLLRVALSLRSYSTIRAKIFIRPDQADDKLVFDFADASKLRAERVNLKWSTSDLYGLLVSRLANTEIANVALSRLVSRVDLDLTSKAGLFVLPQQLKSDEKVQAQLFSWIAGEFMGSDHRRGRTYTWLINHLGDAHGQTAPRTFLTALKVAADRGIQDSRLANRQAIDYHGIKVGVQKASDVRLDQLAEEHPWVPGVLHSLRGLEVPCSIEAIVSRWRSKRVVRTIREGVETSQFLGPVELARESSESGELGLLDALTRLGITEQRSNGKINIPDIFRVAASMKRRGGVRPPGK